MSELQKKKRKTKFQLFYPNIFLSSFHPTQSLSNWDGRPNTNSESTPTKVPNQIDPFHIELPRNSKTAKSEEGKRSDWSSVLGGKQIEVGIPKMMGTMTGTITTSASVQRECQRSYGCKPISQSRVHYQDYSHPQVGQPQWRIQGGISLGAGIFAGVVVLTSIGVLVYLKRTKL